MNVREVALAGFGSHDGTRVELPERGLVLVQGPNGGGKSSLVEAVAFAFWGKSLRGADLFRDGEGCSVSARADVASAARAVTDNGKKALTWSAAGVSPPSYETLTKSQEALEAVVGPFDVWRRASVFSAHDAAHFSLATDAERKRLLEGILGLDRFDGALERCRADAKRVGAAHADAAGRARLLEERLAAESRRLGEAQELLEHATAGAPTGLLSSAYLEALEAEWGRYAAMHNGAERDVQAARAEMRKLDSSGGEHEATARHLRELLHRLGGESCPTCSQPIPEELRAGVRGRAHEAADLALLAKADARERAAAQQAQLAELEQELRALGAKVRDAESKRASARADAGRRARVERTRDSAVEAVKAVGDQLRLAHEGALANQREVALLGAVEGVLGLRGVRAHVLGRALAGLEQLGNAWLARLAGEGLRVALKPYAEKAAGGVRDALSLDVRGAGGGSYRGCSAGERRRIDLAVMLALGELAAAAHGREQGTVFVDEVADGLDEEGRVRAARALNELAEGRCVLLATHDALLAREVSPTRRLRVEGGRVA